MEETKKPCTLVGTAKSIAHEHVTTTGIVYRKHVVRELMKSIGAKELNHSIASSVDLALRALREEGLVVRLNAGVYVRRKD